MKRNFRLTLYTVVLGLGILFAIVIPGFPEIWPMLAVFTGIFITVEVVHKIQGKE